MNELRALYQEVIVDHSKCPRNFGSLPGATHSKEGFNPLCGDRLTLYLIEQNDIIEKLCFEGCGCAISMASASLMTEVLQGKSRTEIAEMFEHFHQAITQGQDAVAEKKLGKLAVLMGVADYPARVKCATLAWHTLRAALLNEAGKVSTE